MYCDTFSEHQDELPSSARAHMAPDIFSGKSQNMVEDHIKNMGSHTAVNGLPRDIKRSIKKYTIDPEEKYDPAIYADIQTAIEQMRPIDVELVLFRGQSEEEIDPQWWISTSTSFRIAIEQFTVEEDCCLIVLKVQPGIKILPVYEFEKNRQAWEQEVIIKGGGELKFLREDRMGRMATFIYQYGPQPLQPPLPATVTEDKADDFFEKQKDLLAAEMQEAGLI